VQTEIFGTFAYNEPIRESVKFRENVWRRQSDPGISAFYFFSLPGDSQASTSPQPNTHFSITHGGGCMISVNSNVFRNKQRNNG
jgi:hypothetical protein